MYIKEAMSKVTEAIYILYPVSTRVAINNGYCVKWANSINRLISSAEVVSKRIGESGHVYVEYNNLCYDSETPEGVTSWEKLPFFIRARNYKIEEEREAPDFQA